MDNSTDPLSQLKDIYLPPDPSLWPPAPGWWLLALIAIILIFLIYKLIRKILIQRRPWKEMHRNLNSMELSGNENHQRRVISKMSELVRQFIILRYGRENVSSLWGKDWLCFLDSTIQPSAKNRFEFTDGIGKILGEQQFQPAIEVDLERLRDFLLQWSRESK